MRGHRRWLAEGVLGVLMRYPEGLDLRGVANLLGVHPARLRGVMAELERRGDVFRQGDAWRSTTAALLYDPTPLIRRLREEIERELGVGAPPELVEAETYHVVRERYALPPGVVARALRLGRSSP